MHCQGGQAPYRGPCSPLARLFTVGEFRGRMSQRIAAFEPSPEYRSVVDCLLDDADGFKVTVCERFDELLHALRQEPADLIIVSFADLPNPEPTLISLRQSVDTPILALVQGPEETKAALRCGADYDLPKPFDPEIFTVAVEAVLRRAANGVVSPSLLPSPDPRPVPDLQVYPHRPPV